ARRAVRGRHRARPPSRADREPPRPRPRGRPRAHRAGEARGAERAPADRPAHRPIRTLGRRAGRRLRPRSARRARPAQPRVRGALRLPLRRLRQPPAEGGDPRRPARATSAHARGGARHRRRGARRDRGGPVAAVLGAFELLGDYATDWLDLVFRWFHTTAAIVWIGTSFYFVALDNHLGEPERDSDRDEGVRGESWEIHGGGFYRIQKFRVAPPRLPRPLHWYRWEAYWTWLSGFALLCVVYYTDARLRLIDPAVADLEPWQAILISIALLAAAWLVYDVACRLLASRPTLLAAALVGLVTATAYGVERLYAPRAAYLQVGAMLGSIMAANVLLVIIPAHWDLVRAKQEG